jgi:predicted DNA-binding protein with PD1-like motif
MTPRPLRLPPGDDLRAALEAVLAQSGASAAFVLQGVGSLGSTRLRLAGRTEPEALSGDFEILTLAGSLSPGGAHLHMSVADASGRVLGGHVAPGCIVRTTVEVLLVLLPEHRFARIADPRTGFAELSIESLQGAGTPDSRAAEVERLR